MQIIIDIDDGCASEILQNIALARGWNAEDDKVRSLLCSDINQQLVSLARNGQTVRKRNEEQAALDVPLKGLTVA